MPAFDNIQSAGRVNSTQRVTSSYTAGGADVGAGVTFATVSGRTMAIFNATSTIAFAPGTVDSASYINKRTSRYVGTQIAPSFSSFDWFVVAGGSHGGGGMRESSTAQPLPASGATLTVTVGGSGSPSQIADAAGNMSTIAATRGGSAGGNGQPGGSGGGAGRDGNHSGGNGNAGGYTPSEGNPGGNGCGSPFGAGGGGGGAGGAGSPAQGCGPNSERGGPGGPGRSSNFTGTAVFYSRGGAQGGSNQSTPVPGGPGTAGNVPNNGDTGQSGVVFIKYG